MRLYSAHQPAQRPGHNGDRGDWKVIGPRSLNPTALAVGNNVLIESRGGQPPRSTVGVAAAAETMIASTNETSPMTVHEAHPRGGRSDSLR
jgi:hypothetical protein